MKMQVAAAFAAMSLAGLARSQTVEFRIVEREGQTSIPNPVGAIATTDAVLNFAVQARVVGGTASQFLGNFGFNIVASGEPDTNGTLAKLLICNADGTYNANSTQSANASIGRGGLAAIYIYLANVNPSFNGLINTSGGTFTNTPGNQEIGLVAGSPTGSALLLLTDLDFDGNPDTYPGTGTTAPIDTTVASTYMGASGNFVDVYRFKYTLSNTSSNRAITFQVANANAQIGSSLALANGIWGPVQSNATVSNTGITVQNDGLGACCSSLGGCTAAGALACSGTSFQSGGSCSPNPCPQPGNCCAASGACTFVLQSGCATGNPWSLGGSCSPNPCPQPGTCCASTGTCSFGFASACVTGSVWTLGGSCSPNPCPQPGMCCAPTGTCSFSLQSVCASGSVWTQGGSCSPNPCPQPGTCCASTGACAFSLQSVCASGSIWTQGGACSPNPCPQPGTCCASSGSCLFRFASACSTGSVWSLGGSCSPNPCPQPGTCCASTGTCSFGFASACVTGSVWTLGGSCSPNPCPQPGMCCAPTGTCSFSLQSVCASGSVWTQGGSCSPNPCPQPGNCCATSGGCAFIQQAACAGVWNQAGSCSPNPCPQPAVEFRIIERHPTPLMTITAGNNVLNFAVQARVMAVPNAGLSDCGLHINLTGEAESNGVLALNTISNADGTYWTGAINNTSTAGGQLVGMPLAFRYLVGINGQFNGLINASGGSWTDNPSQQDIGLITLYSANTGYLNYTDPLGNGHPDSPLNPTTQLNPWFGANGNWIDIYRFQYTVTNLSVDRTINVNLVLDSVPGVFSSSRLANGVWGPLAVPAVETRMTGAAFAVVYLGACCNSATAQCSSTAPTACGNGTFQGSGSVCTPTLCPGGACCTPSNGACVFTGPSGCGSSLIYQGTGTTCAANPCPTGSCCGTDGSCATTMQAGCAASWTAARACSPNPCPQPGTCCALTGVCSFQLHASCAGPNVWTQGGACSPNPCPQPGACCASNGACAFILQSACSTLWIQGGTCSPNPCPQPGTCCASNGSCAVVLQSGCIGNWSQGGACTPNPCPQPGSCCATSGACTFVLQSTCSAGGVWMLGGACSPNPCPQPGSCCTSDGACTSTFRVSCAGLWTVGRACNPNPCTPPHTVVVRTVRAAGPTGTAPWTTAFTNLQTALASSMPGDEIWIADGSYSPAMPTSSNSNVTFAIPSGVRVYGGFGGTETSRGQRNPDPTVHETILSGLDWFNRVVTISSADLETVLDGLTITHGRGAADNANPSTSAWEGAGLFVNASGSVFVANCSFSFNLTGNAPGVTTAATRGGQGGGVYVLNSACKFQSCRFLNNACAPGTSNSCASGTTGPAGDGGNGGAVSLQGSLASFSDCQFAANSAGAGSPAVGCATQVGAGGAGGSGGAVYAANCTSTFSRCSFSTNHAGDGGRGGTNSGPAGPNGIGGSGGAVRIAGGTASVTSCTFFGNTAGSATPTTAGLGAAGAPGGSGGALHASGAQVSLLNSVLAANMAGNGGAGGIDSSFVCARAGGNAGTGGGLALEGGSTASVIACTITQNAPGSPGPGAPTSPPTCPAPGPAGALGVGGIASDAFVSVADSILWNNSSGQIGAPGSSVLSSCVQDGAPGAGNIAVDPLFVSPGSSNYRLAPTSPCIDAASNAAIPASLVGDVTGSPRYVGVCGILLDSGPNPAADMGAYEYQGAGADCNLDGICDLREATGVQVLQAPVPTAGDRFGWKVSLYGNAAVIGARSTNTSAGVGAGAAYMYTRQGALWGDVQTLMPLDAAAGDDFGNWTALDDQWAFVAARFAQIGGTAAAGTVYVYQPGPSGWVQAGKLTAPDPVFNAEFGHGIAVDQNRLVIGALHATSSGVVDCGAAYVYLYNGAGWALETKLVPADPTPGKGFGLSVSISGDTIVIGAPYDGNTGSAGGAAYVYQRFTSGWVQVAKVLPTESASLVDANFAELVAVSGDRFIAGATRLSFMGQSRAGAAYVFKRVGSAWVQEVRLTSDAPATEEWFGYDLTFEGTQAMIGGFRRTLGSQPYAGSAYVYRRFGTTWLMAARIDSPDPHPAGSFGYSIGMNGARMIVGEFRAPWGTDVPSGSARVFDLSLLDGNHDGIPDSCQIASGTLPDTDHNGIPDNVQFNPCRADFNSSGRANTQDIFDFLNAWFSGDPRADFNGVGSLSVQDIFDFLAAWFVGCA